MSRRDTFIPEAQLAEVITALYENAQAKNWTYLSPGDRSRAYSAWVEDERVGGILTKYMTPEAARAWIKDGPMKEYGRALRGAGRYARFGRSGGTTAEDIVKAALGEDWSVVEGTVGVKPFHTVAVCRTGETAYVAWGESQNFKNLIWAALRACVESAAVGHVVVTEAPGVTTPRDLANSHKAIAGRCGMSIHYVREKLGSTMS